MIPVNARSDIKIMGIAHDLNNILSTILGYAEMLRDDLPDKPEVALNAGRIISAVSRAKSLTDQILSPDSLTPGAENIVDTVSIMRETIGYIETFLPPSIKLIRELPEKSVSVAANPTHLIRVFLNIITNALRAMKAEGGELYISIKTISPVQTGEILKITSVPGNYVVIKFRDTGPGLDADSISKIFDPFYSAWEDGSGAGLGLHVVRDIIRDLRGEIRVSGESEKGAVFEIYLPEST
jgi:signal transduction histidine kinase